MGKNNLEKEFRQMTLFEQVVFYETAFKFARRTLNDLRSKISYQHKEIKRLKHEVSVLEATAEKRNRRIRRLREENKTMKQWKR